MRRQVKHICFPNNFSPALYLHRDSPWMEGLEKKKYTYFFRTKKSVSPGLHNSITQAFKRADKVFFPYQSCLFCQTIPTPDVWRATRGNGVLTQLIFYCDKMLAQLKLNVTLATGLPLQIRSELVSFSKT